MKVSVIKEMAKERGVKAGRLSKAELIQQFSMQKGIRVVRLWQFSRTVKLPVCGAKIANYTAVSLFVRHHDSMLLQFTITDPTEQVEDFPAGVQLPSDWAADDSIKYGKQGLIVRHDQCGKRRPLVSQCFSVTGEYADIVKDGLKSTAFKVCQCIVPINGYRVWR